MDEREGSWARRLRLLWAAVVFPAWIGGPFLVAGTVAYWPGLSHHAVLGLGLLAHQAYVRAKNPGLRRRRESIGAGTPRWDVVWVLAFWPLMASISLTAALGFRLGWPAMPCALLPLGLLLVGGGEAVSARAMAENPFFEGTARLQTDREQRVVDTGPYRRLRHPGYLGLVGMALGGPFLLQSWVALGPALLVVAAIVLRTALEDRMLRQGLAGYEDYVARVRSRLVPGVW